MPPNKRVVTGRYGPVTADQAPRKAQEFLGKVAGQDDPAVDRAEARGIPLLGDAVEDCMAANSSDFRGLRKLQKAAGDRFARGVVLYDGETGIPFGNRFHAVPMSRLWRIP